MRNGRRLLAAPSNRWFSRPSPCSPAGRIVTTVAVVTVLTLWYVLVTPSFVGGTMAVNALGALGIGYLFGIAPDAFGSALRTHLLGQPAVAASEDPCCQEIGIAATVHGGANRDSHGGTGSMGDLHTPRPQPADEPYCQAREESGDSCYFTHFSQRPIYR